jgi:diguanylate cyclase (GGDEF)-like protein
MNHAIATAVSSDLGQRNLFISDEALPVEPRTEAHHRIASALQVTLEPVQLLAIFAREVRARMPCNGITYANEAEHIYAADGRNGRHQCTYTLSLNGQVLGQLHFTRSRRFRETELVLLEQLLGAFLYPIRNALLYREAQRAATTDTLTGLKNRAAFEERFPREVERSNRYAMPLSLMMIDIDNFKAVNDSHGHPMGDRLLRTLAQVMLRSIRKADEAFRYGGDELALILPSTDLQGAERAAQRLQHAMSSCPFMSELHPVQCSLSIGAAAFNPDESAPSLVERADAALYQAKKGGRNRICLG